MRWEQRGGGSVTLTGTPLPWAICTSVVKSFPVADGRIEIRQGKHGHFSTFHVIGAVSMYMCLGNRFTTVQDAEKAATKAATPSVQQAARDSYRANKEMWQ